MIRAVCGEHKWDYGFHRLLPHFPRDYLTNHLNAGRAAAFYADGSFEQLDHDSAAMVEAKVDSL